MTAGAIPVASWIDTPEALAEACGRWARSERLALDTEFIFERTYHAQLGLVQVATADEIGLVDPVSVADLTPLARLLADRASVKVIHAAGQDATVLERATGTAPAPLLDTQVAAAFAGLGAALSYAALVEALLGVVLGKHETRTDWLRRPLAPEQLRYAAEDVVYLPPVAEELEARLARTGRLGWALEESTASLPPRAADPERAWRRLRGIERLAGPARAAARSLAVWREREARRLDLARPFLMRDETLLALARRETFDPEEVVKLPGYEARRHAGRLAAWHAAHTAALADAAADPEADVPASSRSRPGREERAAERHLAERGARRAAELGIPAELLLPRRLREQLMDAWRAGRSPSSALAGWRAEAMGPALDD